MTTDDAGALTTSADLGLLCPMWAGTHVAEETGDIAVLRAMLDVEVALAETQARMGLIPDAAAQAIRQTARTAHFDIADIARRSQTGGNPVIPLLGDLRTAVAATNQDAVRFLHLGATSQDILDSALMLVAQRSIRLMLADLDTAVGALLRLADEHRGSVMAARTLTQHSIPTTFGVKAAGWLVGIVDASRKLEHAAEAIPAQLGGAAGTLASFSELAPDREFELVESFAAELGLRAAVLPWHTRRAPITRVGDALATVGQVLGTIGANISLLSRTEIAELQEATGGGSTAMPQKQNPIRSVLLQAIAQRAPDLAAALHRSAATVDERPDGQWHSEWQALRELLRQVGGGASLAADLLTGLRVDTERMRRNLDITGSLIVSERVAIVAGPVIGLDAVKSIVAASTLDLGSLYPRLKEALPDWSSEQLRQLLSPDNYLGANQEIIDRAIAHATGAP